MTKMNKKTHYIAQAGMIAALYVVLTVLTNMLGLAGTNAIQFRLSESLAILAFFTPAAIPGLFIGCFLANTVIAFNPIDMVIGSLATLAAAVWTYGFSRRSITKPVAKWLAPWPAILINAAIIPFVIRYAYGVPEYIHILAIFVFVGQLVVCAGIGYPLLFAIKPHARRIFGDALID